MADEIERRPKEPVALQRWLTEDGKAFLIEIIKGLKKENNLWNPNKPTAGLDFGNITLKDDKKFRDFCCVNQFSERSYRDLRFADLSRQELSGANLQNANLDNANLQGTELIGTNFQSATLKKTNLQNASLEDATLQGATLTRAILQDARLVRANLQNAWLVGANLRGADLTNAIVAGQSILKDDSDEKDSISRIDNNSANFSSVKYSLAWRGPLWVALLFSSITIVFSPFRWVFSTMWRLLRYERPFIKHSLQRKRYAWIRWHPVHNLYEKIPIGKYIFFGIRWVIRKIAKVGKSTKFTDIDTSLLDASKNPGLKRDIEDEQFIADFLEKHQFMYRLWARSSDCGRCLSLWAMWSFLFALGFAIIFTMKPEMVDVHTKLPSENFWTYLYFSVVTFTTLGFGDLSANNLWGALVIGTEVVLGYFFLGGLVAILATKLARRS